MAEVHPIEYRDIPGFPTYRVGSDGSVWGSRHGKYPTKGWHRLSPYVHQKRTKRRTYLAVQLCRDGRSHSFLLHRLILESFVGPRPTGYECRHLDGNPLNCALVNICWGTHAENVTDSHNHDRFDRTITEDQVREIRRRYAIGDVLQRELAAEFGISRTNVNSIVNRWSWKHVD